VCAADIDHQNFSLHARRTWEVERVVLNALVIAVEPTDICAFGDFKAIVLRAGRSTVSNSSATSVDFGRR
jgi:hypothetical protein